MAETLRQKNEKIGELEARTRSLSSDLERVERERDALGDQVADKNLEIENLRSQLSQQQSPAASPGLDLPEPAELLNQLKARNKKSKVTLSDCEAILELLESNIIRVMSRPEGNGDD